MYTQTNEESKAEGFLRLSGTILAKKNAIGISGLNNLNKQFGWKFVGLSPFIIEDIEKIFVLETSAVHLIWTFTEGTVATLNVVKDAEAFEQWDIIRYNSMVLIVENNINSTSLGCFLVSGDVEIPANAIFKPAGNSSVEWEVSVKWKGITIPRRNYNVVSNVACNKVISQEYAKDRNWTYDDSVREMRIQWEKEFARNLQAMVMSPIRKVITRVTPNWTKTTRYTGWIPFFIWNNFDDVTGEVTGVRTDNVNIVAWAITLDHINDWFKFFLNSDGECDTIAGTYDQIMALSSLENSKIRVNQTDATNVKNVGGGLVKIDAPITSDGNTIKQFLVTDELPDGEMWMYDSGSVVVEADLSTFLATDSVPNTADKNYRFRRSIMMMMVIQKAKENFYKFTGITG